MAVCSVPDNGIVAIDEPENGLDPYAVKMFLEALRERAQEHHLTILLATHSPFILNEFKRKAFQVYVMEQNKPKQLYRLDELKDSDWLQNFKLGNLYGCHIVPYLLTNHNKYSIMHGDEILTKQRSQ